MIVVAHNSAADLPICLEALLPTLGPEDEVVVFDSASTDGAAAEARRYGVRVLRSEENVGFGGANNRAAAVASGRWLVFLNPDTAVEPGWLDALLDPLSARPGLATAKILLMDRPDRVNACANEVHLSGIAVCRGFGRPCELYDRDERVLAASGAALAIDRASFVRLGGFDERFFMYLEDTDLSLRAALAGLPCWFVAGSRVRHRHRPSFAPRKLFWLERNRWLMLLKLWSGRTLLALLPMLALMEVLVWSYALLRGPRALGAKAAALGWLLRHPREVVAARRRTQRLRQVDDEALLAGCAWRLDLRELVGSPWLRRGLELLLVVPLAACSAYGRAVLSASSR